MKKRIHENRKVTLTIGQLKRLVKESEDERREVFSLEVYDVSYETDPDYDEDWGDNIPESSYSKDFYDWEEAWDEAEKLVEKYKDREGKFEIRVIGGIYETPDGDVDSVECHDILYMLSGTKGYQGLLNMAESCKNRARTSIRSGRLVKEGTGKKKFVVQFHYGATVVDVIEANSYEEAESIANDMEVSNKEIMDNIVYDGVDIFED